MIRPTMTCAIVLFSSWLFANGDEANDASQVISSEVDANEVDAIMGIEADLDYGEYIAGECLACHAPKPKDASIPVIHGAKTRSIVQALLAYKQGIRENSVMRSVAGNLSEEEIAAAAAFFNAQ